MCEVKITVEDKNTRSNVRGCGLIILVLRTIFHGLSWSIHSFVTLYGIRVVFTVSEELMENPMISEMIKFTPLFLTNWNFLFQTCFLTLSLIYDVLEWLNKVDTNIATKIQYYRDVIFSGLVVPLTCFISSMFWIVFSIDRELVFPEVYDQIVPWWFNHCVHTNITIVVIIETLLQARRHPRDLKTEVIMNGTVGVAYAIVYYAIYFFAKRWLYAVFGIMTWWQVCLYQLLIWGSCFAFYFLQFPVNRLFHREEVPSLREINEEKTGPPAEEDMDIDILHDSKLSPLVEKSWSLKYRSMRDQMENSRL